MTSTSTSSAARDAERLSTTVHGPVLRARDPGFAREIAAHNLAVTHTPDVVVGAATAADVAAAVRFAGDRGLSVAVQATGHGAMRPVPGGVLVTTHRMTGVSVDPVAATARAEGGAVWSSVITAASDAGLAALNGSSPTVGVAGYTTGGGVGPLARAYGFAADAVRRLDVVTADGVARRVDAQHEPDLFWALRGGAGGFAVVTALELDLVPVCRLYGGQIVYPGGSAERVLRAYVSWVESLPERTTTSLALIRPPAAAGTPARLIVQLRVAHLGDAAEGARLLAPMRSLGPVLVDTVDDMPYRSIARVHDDPPDPSPTWRDGDVLAALPDAAVGALLAAAGPGVDLPVTLVEVRHLGGALRRQPRPGNAVGGREAAFSLALVGRVGLLPGLRESGDRVAAAGADVLAALRPWGAGTQVNLLGDAGPARLASAWPPDVHARLQAIKKAVDPADLFRHGHAVRPLNGGSDHA